jgi:hypothetical protein
VGLGNIPWPGPHPVASPAPYEMMPVFHFVFE